MVEINFTFVIFTISFIAFALLMKFFFFDKIAVVIHKREGIVGESLRASQETRKRIEEQVLSTNTTTILKAAKEEAQGYLNKATTEANNSKQSLLDQAKKKASEEIGKSLESLTLEKNQIISKIDELVNEISTLMTDKLIAEIKGSNTAKTLSV